MAKLKIGRKYLKLLAEIILLLLILATFLFSGYKIAQHIGFPKKVLGTADCQGGLPCECFDCPDFCEPDCECDCWCPDCPWPTPTSTPPTEPTPTNTPPVDPTPTPTESFCPSPTPTNTPPADPTPTNTPPVDPTPTNTPPVKFTPTPTPTDTPNGNGGNGGNGNGRGGPPGPPICGLMAPPAPTLLSVTTVGSEQLVWTPVSPVSHYAISYGPSPGNYQWGVNNTGNVTEFIVGGLDPGVNYCFAVRAANECAISELSNEICTGQVLGGQVLGATTLAATGDLRDDIFLLFFIMGSVCLACGLRIYRPAKKLV